MRTQLRTFEFETGFSESVDAQTNVFDSNWGCKPRTPLERRGTGFSAVQQLRDDLGELRTRGRVT